MLHQLHHHPLPDTNFNGNYLINNNISISKKVLNLYISSMVKKCKHRFYIKELLIWICKANKEC